MSAKPKLDRREFLAAAGSQSPALRCSAAVTASFPSSLGSSAFSTARRR